SLVQTLTTEGANQKATQTCFDHAGNSDTDTQVEINIDKAAPDVIAVPDRSPDSNGWYNHTLTVTFTGNDTTSDHVNCDSAVIYSGPDSGGATVTGTCTDAAGNVGSATYSFKYDATAPAITFTGQSPAKNGNGWNNTDVTLSWNCSDSLSGVVAAADSHTISTEGMRQQARGTCQDLAGNDASSTDGDVNLDKTAPTISFDHQSPAPNASGWNNTAISDYWNCADSLSGPASASVSETLGSEGADQSLTGTCTDLAGNTAAETQSHIKM